MMNCSWLQRPPVSTRPTHLWLGDSIDYYAPLRHSLKYQYMHEFHFTNLLRLTSQLKLFAKVSQAFLGYSPDSFNWAKISLATIIAIRPAGTPQ